MVYHFTTLVVLSMFNPNNTICMRFYELEKSLNPSKIGDLDCSPAFAQNI